MSFVLCRPQVLIHTRSCGVLSWWHIFFRSLSLLHVRVWSGPCAYLVGVSKVFLLPLGSFWTHIKLFCFTQPHAGGAWELCGLPLIQLSSSAHSSFLFLKEMIGSCCFPDSTQKKGMGSFWFPFPSLSGYLLFSCWQLSSSIPWPPFMAILGLLGEGNEM